MSDIFQLLHTDHDTMLLLLRRLEQEGESEQLLDELQRTFDGHASGEEQTLYAALGGDGQVGSLIEQGSVEHDVVRDLLGQLATVPMEPRRRAAVISVVREMVELHVAKEEGPIFTRAAAVIPDDVAQQLLSAFAEERRRAA
jgi:hypothetical protein